VNCKKRFVGIIVQVRRCKEVDEKHHWMDTVTIRVGNLEKDIELLKKPSEDYG